MKEAKVYINGRLIGFYKDSGKLVHELIQKRRQAKIDPHVPWCPQFQLRSANPQTSAATWWCAGGF